MKKTLFFGVLFLFVISCNQQKKVEEEYDANYAISTEKWPKKSRVNQRSKEILSTWEAYEEFDAAFDAIYTVENTEDLNLIVEDLIDKQLLLEKSEYPKEFDKPQIKSRQKVVYTFILKIKGHQEYRLDPKEPVLEMIDAYSALRKQFDIITNNTLDIKTLLKEG